MLPKKEYIQLPNYDRQNFITSAGSDLSDIKITGGGKIRSNDGWSWWPRKLTGEFRPHLLTLGSVTNVLIQNIHFEDSPNHNIEVSNCTTVRVDRLFINAPQISPNTDGINFYGGRDQSLTNSIIANGDDCVSVVNLGEADVDCQNNPLLLKCRGSVVQEIMVSPLTDWVGGCPINNTCSGNGFECEQVNNPKAIGTSLTGADSVDTGSFKTF